MNRFFTVFLPCGLLIYALFIQGTCIELHSQPLAVSDIDISLDSLLSIPLNTATKSWQKTKETPASVTIITDKDISRFGYKTLEDVLRSVRSFYISNDRNYSYIGIRGFSRPTDYNNRILLLLNGQTMNENVYGAAPFGNEFPLSPYLIQRIEIVRGPSSVVYGTGAMFATVNIVTKTGSAINQLQATAEIGSFDQKILSAQYGNTIADVDFSVAARMGDNGGQRLYFDEFRTDSLTRGMSSEAADAERFYSITATAKYQHWSLQLFNSWRQKHIPTAPWSTRFNDSRQQAIDAYFAAQVQHTHDFSPKVSLANRLYFQRYHYEGSYPYENYVSDEATTSNSLGGESLLRWDLSANNRFVAGLEYRSNFMVKMNFMPTDSSVFNVNSPFSMFSTFITDEFQITKDIAITAGFRFDDYSWAGMSAITPRLAVVYNAGDNTTLKLLYGSGFRAPNVYEMYYHDIPSGAKMSENLRPERGRTIELVGEQQIDEDLYVVGSLYRFSTMNLIDVELDPVDSMTQYRNSASNVAYGVEVEANLRLTNGLRCYASVSYQHLRTSFDSLLTNSPEAVVKCGIAVPIASILTASLDAMYETSRLTTKFDNSGTTISTKPFTLVNFTVNTMPLWSSVSCSLQIRNLLNTSYSYPGGIEHISPAISQDKRNFWFSVSVGL